MPEFTIVPSIFEELINRADKVTRLTPEVMEEYYATLNDNPSFVPELVALVGPDVFEMFVKYFGGQALQIPRPEDILLAVRRSHGQ